MVVSICYYLTLFFLGSWLLNNYQNISGWNYSMVYKIQFLGLVL